MTTRVVNCKGGNRNFDVYIGRRTWPIPEIQNGEILIQH